MGAKLSRPGGPSSRGAATKLPLIPAWEGCLPSVFPSLPHSPSVHHNSGGQCQVWCRTWCPRLATPTKCEAGRKASPCMQCLQMQEMKPDIPQCIHVTVWIFSLKIPTCHSPVGPKSGQRSALGNLCLTGGMQSIRNNSYLESNCILKWIMHKFQDLEEVCYTNHFVSKLLTMFQVAL